MKKIILAVILLAAAGGIAYYLLQKKKHENLSINKELLIGKWKIDSLVAQKDATNVGSHYFSLQWIPTQKNRSTIFRPMGKCLFHCQMILYQ